MGQCCSMYGWILGCVSGIPADFFAGADQTSQRRETGIKIFECTSNSQSLIITSLCT